MDVMFSNEKTALGASINPITPGYVCLSLCLTEKNLPQVLDNIAMVIGAVELGLCEHITGEFRMELLDSLLAVYSTRKAIAENAMSVETTPAGNLH
jgi:hypothetical protein